MSDRDARLRKRARRTLRSELEGAAKDGLYVPGYGDPGHEDWEEVCHARDVLSLLREVETLRAIEALRAGRQSAKEYVVVAWHPVQGLRFAGPGLGASWTPDLEAVERHYEWLTDGHRAAMEEAARKNEADGFKDGNYAWHNWNDRRSGRKFVRYAIIQRDVAPSSTTLRHEEGFAHAADVIETLCRG